MASVCRILVLVAFILSLTACKDLLSQPLNSAVSEIPKKLEGNWLGDDGAQLAIAKTARHGWYEFRYQQGTRHAQGRFVVSYFKSRLIFNLDVASVKLNELPLVNTDSPLYMLLGVSATEKKLSLTPAQMDQFERHLAPYFFASPLNTAVLCRETEALCASSFSSGNLLLPKRARKFNDDFTKKYRKVFPRKKQVVFKRV